MWSVLYATIVYVTYLFPFLTPTCRRYFYLFWAWVFIGSVLHAGNKKWFFPHIAFPGGPKRIDASHLPSPALFIDTSLYIFLPHLSVAAKQQPHRGEVHLSHLRLTHSTRIRYFWAINYIVFIDNILLLLKFPGWVHCTK